MRMPRVSGTLQRARTCRRNRNRVNSCPGMRRSCSESGFLSTWFIVRSLPPSFCMSFSPSFPSHAAYPANLEKDLLSIQTSLSVQKVRIRLWLRVLLTSRSFQNKVFDWFDRARSKMPPKLRSKQAPVPVSCIHVQSEVIRPLSDMEKRICECDQEFVDEACACCHPSPAIVVQISESSSSSSLFFFLFLLLLRDDRF